MLWRIQYRCVESFFTILTKDFTEYWTKIQFFQNRLNTNSNRRDIFPTHLLVWIHACRIQYPCVESFSRRNQCCTIHQKKIIGHFSFRKVQISNKRTYSIPNGISGHRLKQKKRIFRNHPYTNSSTCELFLTYLQAFNAGFYILSVKWKKIKWRFSFKKQLKLIQRIFSVWMNWTFAQKNSLKKIQGSHLRKQIVNKISPRTLCNFWWRRQ